MSAHLEVILDDLRAGLRHRAQMRRRRARAAGATATTATALTLAVLVGGPLLAERAPATSADGTLTARILFGHGCPDGLACLPPAAQIASENLNGPKGPKE